MFNFFRKYQWYFFLVVTIAIVTSFAFFGTYGAFSQGEKKKDQVVTRLIDGSALMLSDLQTLSRFLATDREDAPQYGVIPNLFNNGVIRYDLFQTGIAEMLGLSYFELIKPELELRLEKAKKFKPYVHNASEHLSAAAVWEQFVPRINIGLAGLQGAGEVSADTFSHLVTLYSQQNFLPPDTLKRILFFQHRSLGLKIDPKLASSDLSLFGFHSLTDWFGRDFITIAAEFLLNVASIAEQKGYQVTVEEAKSDLFAQFQASLERYGSEKPNISAVEHLQSLGLDERSAVHLWRKVLLFRKYFQGVGHATFIDRLPFKDFASYALETANVIQYQWPSALTLKKVQDLIEFQYYLEAVAPPLEDPLSLPTTFYSPEIVEKEYPELVQTSFTAKVKEVLLAEIALRAPVQEVWDWQLQEINWEILASKFLGLKGETREERFSCLEKLDQNVRSQVDFFSRVRLVELHPEWIEEALAVKQGQGRVILLSQKGTSLSGIENPAYLYALFQGAEKEISYSDDERTFYRFEEIERASPPRVITFAEAREQNLLVKISEKKLHDAYIKMRAQKGWKSFAEEKAEIAKAIFPKVFQAVDASPHGMQARLFPLMERAYQDLQCDPNNAHWIANGQMGDFSNQFKFIRKEIPIQRTTQEEWMREKAFVLMPNEWSPIQVDPSGNILFFYLVDKKPSEGPVLDQIVFAKEWLAADAMRSLTEKLLEKMGKNQVIVLPRQQEDLL